MKNKLLGTIIAIIIFLGASTVVSNGAIIASSKTVNSGENVTISITSAESLGSYTVQVKTTPNGLTLVSSQDSNGGQANGSIISGNSNSGTTNLGTFTFKVPTVTEDTKYNIVFSASGTEGPNLEPINGSTATATITVKANNVQPTQPDSQPDTPQPSEPTQQTPQPTQEPEKPAEPTFTDKNETVYVSEKYNTVNVRKSYSTSSGILGSLKKGDSVTRIGVGENGWSKVSFNGQTAYIISDALTTKEPEKDEEKSTVKLLKELSVTGYELTPKFDSQTTKYSLTLNNTDEKLDIKATPEDEKASVNITDNGNFEVGNNIVKITVTAEDGTTRIYTITVTKEENNESTDMLRLSKLQVLNATLDPGFRPEITNYTIYAEDPSSIKTENIIATSENPNVEVTIAENTEDGKKLITVMLEDKKDNKTGVYQITVTKPIINQLAGATKNNANKKIYYILGTVIGVLVILIVIIIIALKKTANAEEEFYNEEDDDELDDDYDYSLKNAINEANGGLDNQYDDMVEKSNAKTQILNTSYNVFKDKENDLDDEEDDDLSNKKKGKHF